VRITVPRHRSNEEIIRTANRSFDELFPSIGADSVKGATLLVGMHRDFDFSLLENGLDFLRSSLDYLISASASGPSSKVHEIPPNTWKQKRDLKYALLHLCSGVELIFKERLRQEHWSLVFKDVGKASLDSYDTGDFQSVTFQEAQDRLIGICETELSQEQCRQLKELRDRRNKLEHFQVVDTLPAVTAIVSSVVSFAIDFVESAFEPESLTNENDTLSEIRSSLGKCNAFVNQRWNEIRSDIEDARSVIECPTCRQRALLVDGGRVKCRFCYYSNQPESAAAEYIGRILGYPNRFEYEKDGGMWPIEDCPECGHETLVVFLGSFDKKNFFCFNCGVQSSSVYGGFQHCAVCGNLYDPGDDDSSICDECFQHKLEKD
jgi:ssDNA-binding Zn-finger/Zn-ribbon topoisomerase 1